jgi:hypothetical protein
LNIYKSFFVLGLGLNLFGFEIGLFENDHGKNDVFDDSFFSNQLRILNNQKVPLLINEAIKVKDFRFVGIRGYAVCVPEIKDRELQSVTNKFSNKDYFLGIKVLKGTSDCFKTKLEKLFNEKALDFSKEYNNLLKARLNNELH